MRTIIKTYSYLCDVQSYDYGCEATEDVARGDAIPAWPGALHPNTDGVVRTAGDADKVMRLRFGWKITSSVHLCPHHKGS